MYSVILLTSLEVHIHPPPMHVCVCVCVCVCVYARGRGDLLVNKNGWGLLVNMSRWGLIGEREWMGTYWWIRVGGEHGVSFFDGERWRFLGRNISGTVTDCGRPKKHKITQLELWTFMKNSFDPTQSHHHYHSWWHGHWSGRWHVTMRHLCTKDSELMPKYTHGSMHSSTGQKSTAHQTWSLVNHISWVEQQQIMISPRQKVT